MIYQLWQRANIAESDSAQHLPKEQGAFQDKIATVAKSDRRG